MIVHILCSVNKPYRVYADKQEAYTEYRRLQDLDDNVQYAVISMPVQQKSSNKGNKPDAKGQCKHDGWKS